MIVVLVLPNGTRVPVASSTAAFVAIIAQYRAAGYMHEADGTLRAKDGTVAGKLVIA